MDARRITIIGVGLIGGSIGMAIKARWPEATIAGYDIDKGVLQAALESGVIDEAAAGPADGCRDADFVFIAVPVSAIPKVMAEMAGSVGPRTIVTDVGSTKTSVVAVAESLLPPEVNFIGGHPMAGSEQEGLGAATPALLQEAVYVLTPTPKTSPEAFQKLHALLTKLGAKVMALSPEKHDEVVAAVSHLPHLTASTLVNSAARVEEGVENRLFFAAGGFRDLTRIASGSPSLWVDICFDNTQAIVKSIDQFISGLKDVRDIISRGDRSELLGLLEAARDRRASMAAGEPAAGVYREFDVPVSDQPGAISQLTLTFGQLGINIEDIQIVPLSGDRGVVKLLVHDNPNLLKALAQLKDYGFDVIERTR